jgi:hypothetical protein
MNEFLERLKQRKLVRLLVAYVAAAFALLQGDCGAQRVSGAFNRENRKSGAKCPSKLNTFPRKLFLAAQIFEVIGWASAWAIFDSSGTSDSASGRLAQGNRGQRPDST